LEPILGSSVLFTTKGTKAAKEAQRVDRQGTEERMIDDWRLLKEGPFFLLQSSVLPCLPTVGREAFGLVDGGRRIIPKG